MAFYRRYSLLLGILALILTLVLLLSTPGVALSPGVTFIDSELHRSSGEEAYVRTRMDFGSAAHVSSFPKQIGEWTGYDYDTREAEESLKADVILLRGYDRPGLYQPLFFLIMQAKTESSFHPPPVCYAGLGYEIGEESKEQLPVSDAGSIGSPSGLTIPLQKMEVFKVSDGEVNERRIVLYYYVKGNQLTSDNVTMIRIEALAPIEGSYGGILGLEKDFLALTFPYMFEPAGEGNWNPLIARIAGVGAGGYFAIILLLLFPVAVILFPRTGPGRRFFERSGPNE